MSKYQTPDNEGGILPNLLNLSTKEEIDKEEARGFIRARMELLPELRTKTVFDLKYINSIHSVALGRLYSFAGKYRTVNMSKGGFAFPSALHIEQNLKQFEQDVLLKLPHEYDNKEALVKDIAKVHAELLFIHPFREGNGRTARILAEFMALKAGCNDLNLSILKERYEDYVIAVQQASAMNYKPMEDLIRLTL